MARSPEAQEARVSIIVQGTRRVVARSASLPLPIETLKPRSEGWEKAEQLNRENYGIIIAHMHASKGDPPRVLERIFLSPTLGRREVFAPIAMHQLKGWHRPVGAPIGVQVFPVFTPETQTLAQKSPVLAKKLKDKYGIDVADSRLLRVITTEHTRQYIDQAILLLQKAGVEMVAPQGHREETLTTMTTAIESVVKRALDKNIHNIAVLFVGYDIKDVQNYGDKNRKNYNFFQTYRFHDGKCLTVDELFTKANGNLKKLREIIRLEMQATVPLEYLPKPS